MLDMTSFEIPCADGRGQVDKNQHLKFAAMKVKNGVNESKKVMMINMVIGVVFVTVYVNTSSVSVRRQRHTVRGLGEHKLKQCGRKR
jgi:hypothetical protein